MGAEPPTAGLFPALVTLTPFRLGADRARAAIGYQFAAGTVGATSIVGAAGLSAAYSPSGRAELIQTTARGQTVKGVGAGTRAAKARSALHLRRRFAIGRMAVLAARGRRGPHLLAGIRGGHVRWLALTTATGPRARADLRLVR